MSIGNSLFAIVSSNAAVAAILGTNPCRFYPGGNLPQDAPMPGATYQTVAGEPANVFYERAPGDNERVQIDCWGLVDNYDSALALHDAVRTALEDQSAMIAQGLYLKCVSFNGHDYDETTHRYRASSDWSCWQAR